jgi:DHA2 family multidrug resistance protein-like MFS transporter
VRTHGGEPVIGRQRRLADPLLDLRLLASRTFTAAMGGMTVNIMLTGAVMLLVTQYFQLVDQLSPVRAGLCMLPAAASMTANSLSTPRLARLTRPAYLITAGLAIAIAGLLVIAAARGVIDAAGRQLHRDCVSSYSRTRVGPPTWRVAV